MALSAGFKRILRIDQFTRDFGQKWGPRERRLKGNHLDPHSGKTIKREAGLMSGGWLAEIGVLEIRERVRGGILGKRRSEAGEVRGSHSWGIKVAFEAYPSTSLGIPTNK